MFKIDVRGGVGGIVYNKVFVEICLVAPKERTVTLRVAGLAVPGYKGPSAKIRSPTKPLQMFNPTQLHVALHSVHCAATIALQ